MLSLRQEMVSSNVHSVHGKWGKTDKNTPDSDSLAAPEAQLSTGLAKIQLRPHDITHV